MDKWDIPSLSVMVTILLGIMANFRERSHERHEGGDGNNHEDLIAEISKFKNQSFQLILKEEGFGGDEEEEKEATPAERTTPGQSHDVVQCVLSTFSFSLFTFFFRFSNQHPTNTTKIFKHCISYLFLQKTLLQNSVS